MGQSHHRSFKLLSCSQSPILYHGTQVPDFHPGQNQVAARDEGRWTRTRLRDTVAGLVIDEPSREAVGVGGFQMVGIQGDEAAL